MSFPTFDPPQDLPTIVSALVASVTQLEAAPILVAAPDTATSTGTAGQLAYGITGSPPLEYLYVCVAANTWVRAALSTF
jgi:hypothetical protein